MRVKLLSMEVKGINVISQTCFVGKNISFNPDQKTWTRRKNIPSQKNHFMRNTLVLSEQIISSKYTNDVPYSVEKNGEERNEVIT